MSNRQPAAALDASLLVRPPAALDDTEPAPARAATTLALTLAPAQHLRLRLLAARARTSQRALLLAALDRFLAKAGGD